MTHQDTTATTTSLSEETLSRARDRALDLTQPLCRITDCADRTDVLADELLRLAIRALALSRDLRAQSVSADQHLCVLLELLGNEEADR